MSGFICLLRGHRGGVHLCQPPNGSPSLVICQRCHRVIWRSVPKQLTGKE